jgi:hypothetical protein
MKRSLVTSFQTDKVTLAVSSTLRLPTYDVAKNVIASIHRELKLYDTSFSINYGNETPVGKQATTKSKGQSGSFYYYYRKLEQSGSGVLCFSPNFVVRVHSVNRQCTGEELQLDEGLLAKRRKVKQRQPGKPEAQPVKTFALEHKRLREASPHYANFCSLMIASGIRVFRFIGPEAIHCRILFFSIMAAWDLLEAAYLTSVPPSQEYRFVTHAGEILRSGMICSQLPDLDGITTIYVLPSALPVPLVDEDEEAAAEEAEAPTPCANPVTETAPVGEIVVKQQSADLAEDVQQLKEKEVRPGEAPRIRLVTQEVCPTLFVQGENQPARPVPPWCQ